MNNQKMTVVTLRRGLILTAIIAAASLAGSPAAETHVTIPVMIPLTGNSSDQGQWIQQGLQLASEEINSESDLQIRLHFEDSQGDPKLALSAYRYLRFRAQFPAILTWGSGVALALRPLVNADKVIQMGIATATPDYSYPGDFNFRNFPSAVQEAEFLVSHISKSLGVTEIAILKLNNDYGTGSAETFRERFEKIGGKVVLEDSVEPGHTDFRTQLLRLKSANPSHVYLAVYPIEGALILKQSREIGISSQFLASVAILGHGSFFSVVGEAAEGLIVATSAPRFMQTDGHTAVDRFVSGFVKMFGTLPTPQHIYAARAYDALYILVDGIKKCSSENTECLRDYLFTVDDYQGAGGVVSFDRSGDVDTRFSFQKVRNGEFVLLDDN